MSNAADPFDPTSSGTPVPSRRDGHSHSVQFYDDEIFLCEAVADFVDRGLRGGHPVKLIATPEHEAGIRSALHRRRADPSGSVDDRLNLTAVNARDLLGRFMVDSRPDAKTFHATIEELLRPNGSDGDGSVPHAFGEMVDLLWRDGNAEAALRLEDLWNEYMASHPLALLCGYGLHGFSRVEDAEPFLEICRRHQHVVPAERYTERDEPARMIEISALQQRAKALETEIESRKQLETRLRRSLSEQDDLLDRERRAREEAEDANRAKRDFLAVMSHELRTPLNAIAGFAELLDLEVHGPVTEGQRQCLERIQLSQQRLLGLIDEVLIFSRTESGRLRYELADVSIDEAIRTAELEMVGRLREKEIRYSVDGAGAPVLVRADRPKLVKILANLLGNAIKFTRIGGQVSVAWEAADGEAVVRVRDTGIGIPADKLDVIFQPFVQVDTRLIREHEGAGLGLAISREFAKGMGGDIAVDSRPGEGTIFTLRLPLAST